MINIDSFDLPKSTINKMGRLLNNSKRDKIAYGFDICSTDHKLINRNEYSGDIGKITIMGKCGPKENLAGYFRAYPTGGTRQSISDQIVAYTLGIGCNGSAEDDKINCYVRKGKYDKSIQNDLNQLLEKAKNLSIRTVGFVFASEEDEEELKEINKKENENSRKFFKKVVVK